MHVCKPMSCTVSRVNMHVSTGILRLRYGFLQTESSFHVGAIANKNVLLPCFLGLPSAVDVVAPMSNLPATILKCFIATISEVMTIAVETTFFSTRAYMTKVITSFGLADAILHFA